MQKCLKGRPRPLSQTCKVLCPWVLFHKTIELKSTYFLRDIGHTIVLLRGAKGVTTRSQDQMDRQKRSVQILCFRYIRGITPQIENLDLFIRG